MNKKITSSVLAAVMIAGTTSFTTFAAMPEGTVVIGSKAFNLGYANNVANAEEIGNAIVAGGAVYVKGFNGDWIDNITGLVVNASVIPAVVYKNAAGVETNYDAKDMDVVTTTSVTSISGINAKTLEVKFNKAVDATDAAITSKYAVGQAITSAVVSEDAKTVTLTTETELKVSNAKVTVSPIKTKADITVLTPEFNALLTFADTTAASVKSVDAKGTKAVITFNEPLQSEGTVSLDGVQLSDSQYTLLGNTLTITGLTADTSYKVDVVSVADFAGNISNPMAVNFTVAKLVVDSSKPTVTSTVNGTEITIDFSEELSKQNLDATSGDEEYAKVTVGTNVFYLTDAEIKDSTDKTKFTVDAETALGTAKFINTTVKVEGQKDLASNAGDAFEFNATLTKDSIPATLSNTSTEMLVADNTAVTTDKDALYLTFNEAVKVNGKITVKTKNGIVYTAGTVTNVNNMATGAGIDLDANGKIEGAELNTIKVDMDLDSNSAYTFELAAKSVTDLSGNVNSEVITFNAASGIFQSSPGTVTDSLVFAATTPVVVNPTNNKEFTLEYAASVTTSATMANNYTLGGKVLPAGTELQFVDGTKKVRFTLPEESITANGDYVLYAKNVKDTTGNTLTGGKATVQVPLKESVAPVASNITVVDSKNFTVGFSELLVGTEGPKGIIVKVNGTVVTATATNASGKLAVKTTNDYSSADAITVEFKATNLVDANGNSVKDSVISK
ncbi:MAG: hypothetical protein ACI8WT_003463 [Clostridium sp.]|jgi:hypothetical protein